MTELKCPQCQAEIEKFWIEGLKDRWFVYCTQCHKIVHIRTQEVAFTDYRTPLHAIMAN